MYNIRIQEEDFFIETEFANFDKYGSGAVVSFIGYVRDFNKHDKLNAIHLDCYKEMAYQQIEQIIQEAIKKFKLNNVKVIHRINTIKKYEQIVLILVSATHRKEAFQGCEFIIDYLKKQAPFFKKEIGEKNHEYWL